MIHEKIEELKRKINVMIISEEVNREDILRTSQDLDALIVEFMIERDKGKGNEEE